MASVIAWKKRIYGALAATMSAGSYEDLLPDLTPTQLDRMPRAELARLYRAWTEVEESLRGVRAKRRVRSSST